MSMKADDKACAIAAQEADNFWLVPQNQGLKITGTFLDEISHDIPHQNWGVKEWDLDFQHMKAIGIDTVIMIRSGYRKFITFNSPYLLKKGCYRPSQDLLEMFLTLADMPERRKLQHQHRQHQHGTNNGSYPGTLERHFLGQS